jgi:hypothetical protein
MSEAAFEGWAIVELMGHRRLGAYVRETELAGAAMLRLDVPEHPWQDGCTCGSDEPANLDPEKHTVDCHLFREEGDDEPRDVYATQFYSASALYCLTPATEAMARALRSRPTPVQVWEIPKRQLEPAAVQQAIEDDLSEVFDHDDDDVSL